MILGMDFGTTNSGAALFDGQHIHQIALDPANQRPEICRSAIYMTRTGDYYLGSGAMNTYFDQNIGRPTRFRKVWVGEIIQIFAELPVFYRDVFVYEDEFSPGRLFTSIKTALRSRDYFGTAFRGNWFSASDLVAIFLMGMKMQMEQQLDRPVKEVVMGRPVHFSMDPIEDQIAQSRLLDAAFKAGFERVFLEYEPVAAALAYERQLTKRELVLIFDFGGGTLDFTVMQVGGRHSTGQRVLSTGGVPIAGDIFDQRLFRVTIPRHLGEGLEYRAGGARRPIPAHIFDTLSQPPEILSLNTPQNLEMLRQIHAGSPEPEKTHALIKVVSSNYALMMFDLVERAKQQLSNEYLTNLVVKTPDFSFREQVSRTRFERAIAHEASTIRIELMATLERAGVKPRDVNRVIRTGGSSQIPMFVNMLDEIFGFDKVLAIDTFSSVTAGLAIRAYQISKNKVDLVEYTADTAQRSQEHTVSKEVAPTETEEPTGDNGYPVSGEARVAAIDLDGVLRRLQVRQEARQAPAHLPEHIIFILNRQGIFAAAANDLIAWVGNGGDPGDPSRINQSVKSREKTGQPYLLEYIFSSIPDLSGDPQFVFTDLDRSLLFVTNRYKLISANVQDLYLAQQADPDGIVNSLPLDFEEMVTAMMSWKPERVERTMVCMVTAAGQSRAFDAAVLAEAIARRPYFQLERRYTGIPVRLFTADPNDVVLIGTDLGRMARATVTELSVQPLDLLRLRSNEWVSATGAFTLNDQVIALNKHAASLMVDVPALPASGPPAQRGQYLRRNTAITALVDLNRAGETYAVTELGWVYPLAKTGVPGSIKLNKGDRMVGTMEI